MRIFISYRRDDSSYATSAIFDQITAHFGKDSAFLDVASIPLGVDFPTYLKDWITSCDVLLAVIGEYWLTSKDSDGNRRIDNPHDVVRIELEAALERALPVIPVLVGETDMPIPEELPTSLRELSYKQAIHIKEGRAFSAHVARLIRGLERFTNRLATSDEVVKEVETKSATYLDDRVELRETAGSEARGGVFISYRRESGAETARLIRYELLDRGWRVFLDVENLGSGEFDKTLLKEIEDAENFVLILSSGALNRCSDERDWLRQEIVHAIEAKRNVVPLLKENCARPNAKDLPELLAKVASYNCVEYSHVYYDAAISRLVSFLVSEDDRIRRISNFQPDKVDQ